MLKIKAIIEELNTMIIALCDQNYVLNEEYIILGIYLYTDISCLGGIFSKNTSREKYDCYMKRTTDIIIPH